MSVPIRRLASFIRRRSPRGAIAALLTFAALCLWWTAGSLEARRVWLEASSFRPADTSPSGNWVEPPDPNDPHPTRLVRRQLRLGALVRAEWTERLITENDTLNIPATKPAAMLNPRSFTWRFTGVFHATSAFFCCLLGLSLWRWWSHAEWRRSPPANLDE
jgi:hypothetical protein